MINAAIRVTPMNNKNKLGDRFSFPATFPATLTPDLDGGGYVVRFRDSPEAITQDERLKFLLLVPA